MSKRTTRDDRLDEPELGPGAASGDGPSGPDDDGGPEDALARVTRQRDEYLESWKRAQADYQNLKRRALAEAEAAALRDQRPLLEELLLVLDHLDMALGQPFESEEARNLATGVRMTRDQLVSALESQEVERIDTEGDFDPERHQAVATIPTADAPPGHVLRVVRTGWTHRGQVLRYAQVEVATAPRGDRAPGEEG